MNDRAFIDAIDLTIERLLSENEKLRSAMKRLRDESKGRGYTMRRFADAAGVSPTQMSEWTADPITTKPDLVD